MLDVDYVKNHHESLKEYQDIHRKWANRYAQVAIGHPLERDRGVISGVLA